MCVALLACGLLVAAPSIAQRSQAPGALRLTLFGSAYAVGYGARDTSSAWGDGGLGLAVEYRWRPRLGLELSLSQGWHSVGVVRRGDAGVRYFDEDVTSYPIDLMAKYGFVSKPRWELYAGLGAHYVEGPASSVGRLDDRLSPQFNLGVDYLVSPRLSLTIDAKRLLREGFVDYDPPLKASVGIGWRF